MPVKGSADVGGKHREASADSTLLQRNLLFAGPATLDSQELRITGLSRVTYNILQTAGGAPGSYDIFFRIREDSTPILYGTVIIGAIGIPEVVTIHLTGRKTFVRLNAVAVGNSVFTVSIFSTGQS